MSAAEPRPALPTIQMFWYGAPLSRLERLSVASFLANGHAVDLYAYDDIGAVPHGARMLDAARILPRDALFRHRRTGSVGLFSDWFRYRLLFERGGIWADCDMVCLQPLDVPACGDLCLGERAVHQQRGARPARGTQDRRVAR